jgi:hypothetical protein
MQEMNVAEEMNGVQKKKRTTNVEGGNCCEQRKAPNGSNQRSQAM